MADSKNLDDHEPEGEDKYIIHRKIFTIIFSIIIVILVLLDTYWDQQKPKIYRPIIPITLPNLPKIPEVPANEPIELDEDLEKSVQLEEGQTEHE